MDAAWNRGEADEREGCGALRCHVEEGRQKGGRREIGKAMAAS